MAALSVGVVLSWPRSYLHSGSSASIPGGGILRETLGAFGELVDLRGLGTSGVCGILYPYAQPYELLAFHAPLITANAAALALAGATPPRSLDPPYTGGR